MAIDNLPTITSDESRLSGAYIRTLVKQLTSSTKPTNNHQNLITNNGRIVGNYTQSIVPNNKGENFGMAKQKNQNAQGHKKQVRRRLHTSRPYQERLLNMAEARKEIVTALKFHRAAMKKASEKNQQLDYQTPQEQQSILRNCEIVQPKIESLPFTNTNPMVGNFSYHPSSYDCNSYPWLISSLPLIEPSPNETLNIPLPNQTLGLNLNLQAFANLDTTFCHSINTPSSNLKYNSTPIMSPSSSSSSSTPRDLVEAISSKGVGPIELMNGGMDMHCALDEEEMAKIRSIGEQHQIEWDDTLDLAKSAWWFKFLKSVEFGKEIKEGLESNKHNGYSFEEFPPWLSANEQSFLQQHFEESCSEGTSLPWVDIGDIDGMDEDWLS